MSNIDWPSWIMAFASVTSAIGVFIAIYVPWRIHRSEQEAKRNEYNLRARSIALSIFFSVTHIRFMINSKLEFIDAGIKSGHILNPHGSELSHKNTEELNIKIPEQVLENADYFYLLGESAGQNIIQTITFLKIYNEKVDRAYAQFDEIDDEELKSMRKMLGMAANVVKEAEDAIREIHDGRANAW